MVDNKRKTQSEKRKTKVQSLKLLVLSLSFAFFALHFTLDCFAQDKIVAVVNNDIITQKDLDDFVNFMRVQLSSQYKGRQLEEKIQSIKLDLLQRLIEDRLILEEAKKSDIQIDENRLKERVRDRFNEIKRRYPSDADLQKELMKQGLVQADLEEKIREQLLMSYIVDLKVRSKISVRPGEITSFYNSNLKEFMSSETRQVEIVILENGDLAKSFAYSFKRGEKIADLAARYPITVNQISVIKGGELRKDIEEEIFKLGLSEVSNPIKVDTKYYIFKLINIIPPKQRSLSEVQDKIYSYLFDQKMEAGLVKWLDELRAYSYIQIKQN